MIGTRKTKKEGRVRVGLSIVGYAAGKTVSIKQHDTQHHKVLVDFGSGFIDWLPDQWVENNCA